MADHELSAKDAIFEAHFAVKMGEVIVTGKIKSLRHYVGYKLILM